MLFFPDGRAGRAGDGRCAPTSARSPYTSSARSSVAVAPSAAPPGGQPGQPHRLQSSVGSAAWFGPAQAASARSSPCSALPSSSAGCSASACASGERRQQLKWLGAGRRLAIARLLVTIAWTNAPGSSATPAPGRLIAAARQYRRRHPANTGSTRSTGWSAARSPTRSSPRCSRARSSGLIALTTDALALSGRVGVAASTLAAAALFNPLRIRIQRVVDRRFNRARYDAEATVAAFTARLRDAVEIDAIRADLLDAVNRAVEPTHASVWIRQQRR